MDWPVSDGRFLFLEYQLHKFDRVGHHSSSSMTVGRQEGSSLQTTLDVVNTRPMLMDARKLPEQRFQYHNLGIVNILSLMESRARNFVELVLSLTRVVSRCRTVLRMKLGGTIRAGLGRSTILELRAPGQTGLSHSFTVPSPRYVHTSPENTR